MKLTLLLLLPVTLALASTHLLPRAAEPLDGDLGMLLPQPEAVAEPEAEAVAEAEAEAEAEADLVTRQTGVGTPCSVRSGATNVRNSPSISAWRACSPG